MKDKETFDELQRQKKRKLQTSEERQKEFNNPAKSAPVKGGKKRAKKNTGEEKTFAKKFGIVLTVLQAVLSGTFLWALFTINLLPMKYMAVVIFLVAVLFLITLATQKRHKGRASYGKALSILMVIILGLGTFYLFKMNGAFDKVTGSSYKIDSIVVAVLKDDPAESIADAKDYTFGVQYAVSGDDVKQAVEAINKEIEAEIAVKEYASIQEQATALHAGEVNAIIYNEGYTGMLNESISGYESSIKVIYRHEIKTEVQVQEPEKVKNFSITEDTFNVYLSGIDVYGAISTNSRSDVNIIATVNPKTRQILLTTTPRDFFVTIPGVSGGQRDKLTHAGIYGVDASIATLENLYDTEIPFYARVNFTSIMEIVNVLGGVDVYSEYSFTTSDNVVYIQKGMNHLNGKQALSFARERYNVPGGDEQRGRNQQAVIVAMIRKMISPQILIKANGIIDSVSGNVETNMSQKQIQQLIKMQLNEGGSWNIYSTSVTGSGGSDYTYSIPGTAVYVMYPDATSVGNAQNLMKRVEDGEKIDGSEVAE